MKYSEIMVRYGELSTKGKNRKSFIMQLAQNVRQALKDFPEIKIHADRDRMHLLLNGADGQLVIPKLAKIFGIQNFSPSIRVEKDVEVLKQAVQDIMKEIYTGKETFKIIAKRSDHQFELTSNELNQTLGNAVFDIFPHIQVQMRQPDIPLRVEIRRDGAYLSYETIKGAGGLPVGTSGKGMLMLSGGIDSPVDPYYRSAIYRDSRRNQKVSATRILDDNYSSNDVAFDR